MNTATKQPPTIPATCSTADLLGALHASQEACIESILWATAPALKDKVFHEIASLMAYTQVVSNTYWQAIGQTGPKLLGDDAPSHQAAASTAFAPECRQQSVSGPDLVPGQPVQAGTVSPPLRLTSRWYTIAAVELYSLGRGVTVVGQKGHLPRREGTLELQTGRMCFVIDPLAAEHAQGPVLTIECDVAAIIETFEAIDEVGTVELPTIECRHGSDSPHKTAILSLPSGMGKSTIAPTLAKWLGCIGVVDDWYPGAPMVEGGLHLTSSTPAEWMEGGAA